MSLVNPTQGSQLFIMVFGTLSQVKGLQEVTGFGSQLELEDISDLDSTAKEYRAKIPDGKEFNASIKFNPNDPVHREIEKIAINGETIQTVLKNAKWVKDNVEIVTFDSDTEMVKFVGHEILSGTEVSFSNEGGGLPSEIIPNKIYKVADSNNSDDAFKLTKLDGTNLVFSDNGTAVSSIHYKTPTITSYAFDALITSVDKPFAVDTIEKLDLAIKPTGEVVITDDTVLV